MNENVKEQDVLLLKEKSDGKLYAAGMDKSGKVNAAKPEENPDFLKIDIHGNLLKNFFENFMRQIKNPTRFEFFRVPADKISEAIPKLEEAFKNPGKKENKEFIDMHRVNPEDFLKQQAQGEGKNQTPIPEKDYAIDSNLVNWDKLSKFGITIETLEKTGNLDQMLNYRKTNLLTVAIKVDDETTIRTDARFSLRRQDDGTFTPSAHLIRKEPDLERPYFGITFSEEDKKYILKTGNLGRVVEAEFRAGEKTPVFVSLDKLTNEIVSAKAGNLLVPDSIKGVQLSEQQKNALSEGKAVHLENMISKKGTPFNASVQYSADMRGFEFLFDNENKQSQKQGNRQTDVQKTFRGQSLSEDQRDSLREGKTVHVGGLVDKSGKPYSGYITLNKETGKTDFMFPHEYKKALAEGNVTADDRHKTQVAVNSDGKTNEATKNSKEPLKQGQTNPTEKQAEKQEAKTRKGVKM